MPAHLARDQGHRPLSSLCIRWFELTLWVCGADPSTLERERVGLTELASPDQTETELALLHPSGFDSAEGYVWVPEFFCW